MRKLLSTLVALSLMTGVSYAGQVNQFEIAKQNKHYNGGGNGYYPPPPPYYHKKHHNNNNYWDDNGAAIAGGIIGFAGGLIAGQAFSNAPPPAYVPPAYVVPGGASQEVCTTVWTMEPDGFGGWQRAPHTACYWE